MYQLLIFFPIFRWRPRRIRKSWSTLVLQRQRHRVFILRCLLKVRDRWLNLRALQPRWCDINMYIYIRTYDMEQRLCVSILLCLHKVTDRWLNSRAVQLRWHDGCMCILLRICYVETHLQIGYVHIYIYMSPYK